MEEAKIHQRSENSEEEECESGEVDEEEDESSESEEESSLGKKDKLTTVQEEGTLEGSSSLADKRNENGLKKLIEKILLEQTHFLTDHFLADNLEIDETRFESIDEFKYVILNPLNQIAHLHGI